MSLRNAFLSGVLCLASICGCKPPVDAPSSTNPTTSTSPTLIGDCPEHPTGTLTRDRVQAIEVNQQSIEVSGIARSGVAQGYSFEGEAGQELSFSTEEDLCIWVFTPDNQLLNKQTKLPVSGTYILQISVPQGSRTFKLAVGLHEQSQAQANNPTEASTGLSDSASSPISPSSSSFPTFPTSQNVPQQLNSQPEVIDTERVEFSQGGTGASLQSSLDINQSRHYLLWCEGGQNMSIAVERGSVQVTIVEPSGKIIGTVSPRENRWQGRLPTDGDYRLEVLADGATNYTVSVEVL